MITPSKIKVEIVSVEGVIFSGDCFMSTIPAINGEMGIMANHESFLTKLKDGIISIYENESKIIFSIVVEKGYAEFDATNKLNILL